jgi:hypothetical protein
MSLRKTRPIEVGAFLLALLAFTGGAGAQAASIEIASCGTVINTPGEYTASHSLASTSATEDCIDINSPGVSLGISNITISGPGGADVTAAGIKIAKEANGVQLFMLGATIKNFGIGIDEQASGVIISAAPTGGTISGNTGPGILVSHASDVLIDSVDCEVNGGSGLELLYATGVTVKGVPLLQENDGYGLCSIRRATTNFSIWTSLRTN